MATSDMSMDSDTSSDQIPQTVGLVGQVPNSAGGYSWPVSDWTRLRRFLCLGSEGGSYYIKQKQLGKENAEALLRLLTSGDGPDAVIKIMQFSTEGRAAKQEPIIFSLAMCARLGDEETKKCAYKALPSVCRIPTHLFAFVEYCQTLSAGTGWGRAHRRAVSEWYTEKKSKNLSMLVTKYQQRNGWSHRDLLRLSHLKTDRDELNIIFRYIIKGLVQTQKDFSHLSTPSNPEISQLLNFLNAVELAKSCTQDDVIIPLIKEYGLVREHVPTPLLKSVEVWRVLLQNMPMTALIRNLGKMTAIELLAPLNDETKLVCQKLQTESILKSARIHPFNVLVALKTYSSGKGDKGSLQWNPVPAIESALDKAFYLSFKFVEPTGKRFLVALDVSGSMSSPILGTNVVSCRDASAAMAMATMKTESNFHVVGFSDRLVDVKINPSMDLNTVIKEIDRIPFGRTDCSLPMTWAIEKKAKVDVFLVYTDSETNFGKIHPSEALKSFRSRLNPEAKLIVVGMSSNGFTIADPDDAGMLDIAGFDSAAPQIIRSFSMGEI